VFLYTTKRFAAGLPEVCIVRRAVAFTLTDIFAKGYPREWTGVFLGSAAPRHGDGMALFWLQTRSQLDRHGEACSIVAMRRRDDR
jgi:hypothetical protein